MAKWLFTGAGKVMPSLPIPIGAYLDPSRVFGRPWTQELFRWDPLIRRSYPLGFVAELMSADTSGLFDGRLRVPVVVLTSRGDPLFPLDLTESTTRRIAAPQVNLIVLDTDCHLVLNEAVHLALPAVLSEMQRFLREGDVTPAKGGAQ